MQDYQRQFNKEPLHLSESEVIELLSCRHKEKEVYDLRHLMHFVTPDLELPEYLEIKGLYIAQMVLREDMGFERGRQPGDFDMIVIPYSDEVVHFERTAAIEVKVVRPTIRKPSRNANSLGIKQIEGLIEDGFPYVGLIHVSITEPLPELMKTSIKLCTLPVGDDTKYEPGKTFEDYLIDIKADYFSWASADTQLKRLVAAKIPKFVSLYCCGLDKMKDGNYKYSQVSEYLAPLASGYFNPYKKNETIERVKAHFCHNRDIYINRRVRNG